MGVHLLEVGRSKDDVSQPTGIDSWKLNLPGAIAPLAVVKVTIGLFTTKLAALSAEPAVLVTTTS